MLHTKIDHFYSSQEKHNIELVKIQLKTEDLDEKEAVENGWLIHENKWYQCRSVRLRTSDYQYQPMPDTFSIDTTKDVTLDIRSIYRDYILIRGFNDISDYFINDPRASYIILKDEGIPVAFTKFIHYNGALESQLNCWNYHKPKLAIGKKMINYEIDHAKSLGLNHLYIGEGCEVSSRYKAELPGFEWWTGSMWSTDKDRYKELCVRDSTVKTIYDLADIFNG